MSEMNILFDGDGNLVHTGEPRVMYPNYVEFIRDGKVVGTISATFDFSDMPDDLHEIGINVISRYRTSVGLPGEARMEADKYIERWREARKALPWWRRWYHNIVDPIYY